MNNGSNVISHTVVVGGVAREFHIMWAFDGDSFVYWVHEIPGPIWRGSLSVELLDAIRRFCSEDKSVQNGT